jgi:hypothetical protein
MKADEIWDEIQKHHKKIDQLKQAHTIAEEQERMHRCPNSEDINAFVREYKQLELTGPTTWGMSNNDAKYILGKYIETVINRIQCEECQAFLEKDSDELLAFLKELEGDKCPS